MVSSIPIEYEQSLNRTISPIDKTLTGTTTSDQSGSGSNGNEELFYTPEISGSGVLSSDVV